MLFRLVECYALNMCLNGLSARNELLVMIGLVFGFFRRLYTCVAVLIRILSNV